MGLLSVPYFGCTFRVVDDEYLHTDFGSAFVHFAIFLVFRKTLVIDGHKLIILANINRYPEETIDAKRFNLPLLKQFWKSDFSASFWGFHLLCCESPQHQQRPCCGMRPSMTWPLEPWFLGLKTLRCSLAQTGGFDKWLGVPQ